MFIKTILSSFLVIFSLILNHAGCQHHRPSSSSSFVPANLIFENADWIKGDFSGTESFHSSLCTDSGDNVYLAGQAEGYWSVPSDCMPFIWREAEYDAYLFKLDSQGNTLWNIWWDHGDLGTIQEIACDSNDDIYILGNYDSGNVFKPSQGHHKQMMIPRNPRVGFLLKYDSGGNLLWTRTWSTGSFDMAILCLEISGSGIYIAGDFSGTLVFDDSANTSITANSKSAMIAKVTPAGDIEWVKIVANDPTRTLTDFENLPDGSWYIVYNVPEQLPNMQGFTDTESPLVARLDNSLTEIWTRQLSYHWGQFAFDKDGNMYFAGSASGNMQITAGNPSPQGPADESGMDRVLYKFDSSRQLLWTVEGDGYLFTGLTVDDEGKVYTCGIFWYQADFDPGPGEETRNSALKTTILDPASPYICKYDSSGNFQWVRSGSFEGYPNEIFLSPLGSLLVIGTEGDEIKPTKPFVLRTPG